MKKLLLFVLLICVKHINAQLDTVAVFSPDTSNHNFTYCTNTAYHFTGFANPGPILGYQWHCYPSNNVVFNPANPGLGQNGIDITFPTTGIYTITLIASSQYNGIDSSANFSGLAFNTTTVNVNQSPTVTVSPLSPVFVCQGATGTNLYASGASTYTWSQGATTTPPTPLSSVNWDSVNVNPPGIPSPIVTYSVVGANAIGCASQMFVVTVSVQPKPIPTYSPNDTICNGFSALQSVTGMPANTTYHWGAAFGAGLGSSSGSTEIENPIYYNVSHGFSDTTIVDTVLVHVPGCPNYAPHLIYVVVTPRAVTSFTLNQDAAPFTWDAYPTYSPNVISAIWNWGDGSSTNGLYPSHTYSVAGTYSICVSVSNGFCNSNYCQDDSVYRLAYNSVNSNMVYINVLSSAAGISQISGLNSQISIYPNPANNQFIIDANTNDKLKLDLYDVNGRVIPIPNPLQREGKIAVDVSSLNEGVYNLSIISSDGVINKRVVIVR